MLGVWHFSLGRDDYVLADSWAHRRMAGHSSAQLLRPTLARQVLDRYLRTQSGAERQVRAVYEHAVGPLSPGLPRQALFERVSRVLGRDGAWSRGLPTGQLVVLHIPRARHGIARAWATVNLSDVDEVDEEENTFIALEAVDPQERPVAGIVCEFQLADGRTQRATTDRRGQARLDQIAPGECKLRLVDLDGSSWRAGEGAASQRYLHVAKHTHTVQQGESLARIAAMYGVRNWRKIWSAPENADLRRRRRDPNVLLPGDPLIIADCTRHEIARSAGDVHRVVVDLGDVELRVLLQDHNGLPFVDAPYALRFMDGGQEIVRDGGQTDSDGRVVERVPATVQVVELTLARPQLSWRLRVGELDPVRDELDRGEVLSGIQARLNGLGYACGPVDGQWGPRTRGALRRFQAASDLESTGEPDAQTLDALVQQYGV